MRSTMKRQRRHGFSLLEVLIALAIFSIGTLALIPLFGMVSWGTRGGRDLTNATTRARTYVDKLRNTPFGNLGPCDPANPTNAAATCTPPAAEVTANGPFVVTWTVKAVDGVAAYNFATPTTPNMKRITVTVTCASCARQNLKVEMATIVSERS